MFSEMSQIASPYVQSKDFFLSFESQSPELSVCLSAHVACMYTEYENGFRDTLPLNDLQIFQQPIIL